MPTLLEKPSTPLPTQVLHSRHSWERWRGVLFAVLIGLVAILAGLLVLHPSWHVPDDAETLAAVWIGGLLLTAISAAVAWRFAPHSLTDTAQVIDRNIAAKNRLEAMAALHKSTSPLANAQRDETADYLRQQPQVRPVRALPWLIGGVIALAFIHFVLLGVWTVPALLQPSAPVPPPPPTALPHATITWKSPEPESKANPVEEVPTVAEAQSTSGLKDLTLEISVNGTPKKSQPLPAQPYDKAGKNTIKVSLYMDELGVEPFDLVSYYIRGQRITDQKLPDTVSAIQFIQVRPFRDDVGINNMPGSPGNDKNLALIIELKLAQLKAMKENFILAHTDLAVTDPVRAKENDRVGQNQGDLSKKTEEVAQALTEAGLNPQSIDLLRQAEPLMDDASKKILATQNTEALPPQGKALDLIIQLEKYIEKVMGTQGSPGAPKMPPPDPFQDKQQHELKQRGAAAAGQLEQLAKKQADLAKDMDQSPAPSPGSDPSSGGKPDAQNKPDAPTPAAGPGSPSPGAGSPGGQANSPAPAGSNPNDVGKPGDTPQSVDPLAPGADKGTIAERQARILQGVETLLNSNNPLPAPVNQALQDAQKHATESVHQLDQGDNAAAREPAALAAQDLQHAVSQMNNAGDKATRQAMEKSQQDLNAAAQKLKDLAKNGQPGSQQPGLSDVAAQVQDVQKQAGDAADQQQESGSAKDAQHLADLANQIGNQHIAKDLGTMAQKGLDVNQAANLAGKLDALANQAAHGMAGDKPSAQEIQKLVSSLQSDLANLQRLVEKSGAQANASQSPAQASGQEPGQDQGKGQGKGDDMAQGQGAGQQPGQGSGQGQQPGQSQGGDQPGGADQGSGGIGKLGSLTDTETKAFHEILSNVQDEAQQASSALPANGTEDVQKQLDRFASNDAKVNQTDVVKAYQAIAPPLDKLIQDLTVLAAQAQRQDLIKQPDLDDAPPSYRPAVSNYFENMSKDYHPDNADAKKP
jgi:hypothetical protein